MSSDFLWDAEKYQQNINPVKQGIDQAAYFLSIQRGIPLAEAENFVKKMMSPKGGGRFVDPTVTYYERDANWVRNLKSGPMSGYLKSAIENGEVIVPTLTTYQPESEEKSLVSVFMKRNAGRRGVLKKQAQVEELKGNAEAAYQLNNQQDNAKRNNNSMSGSMAAMGSIFENPTGHNTLTSITRCMSSFSNALNERMIGGNRHYYDAPTTLNNMTAVAQTANHELIRRCIEVYGLKVPTAEDIVSIVRRSTDKYWRDSRHLEIIKDYASKMSDTDRMAVAYTQDLYHIRQLNPEFMRNLIDDFAVFNKDEVIEEPVKYLKDADPLVTNYAHQVFISRLRGAEKDRSTWDPQLVMDVARSTRAIERATEKYKLLINAFLTVETVPCSTAYISHQSRESVVLSDTDSTMFSVDDWVIWYFGKLQFDDFAFAVAGSIMFISTQLIAHAMAILSANMNVARDKLFTLAMKPEFVFPVFAQTAVAKHYFCSMSVKEGGVFKKNKYEIKGVHLKSSASPASIVLPAQESMMAILDSIEAGGLIDEFAEVTKVADVERKIFASIRNGESEFLKRLYIKGAGAYQKPPEESPYRFHILWNEVFAPSYARTEDPTYTVLKLPMTTTTKTRMMTWINSFEDKALAKRYKDYLARTGRDKIPTMFISKDFIDAYGFPKEILAAIDIKKVVLDLTVIWRMYLATLGHRAKTDTLLSEMGY